MDKLRSFSIGAVILSVLPLTELQATKEIDKSIGVTILKNRITLITLSCLYFHNKFQNLEQNSIWKEQCSKRFRYLDLKYFSSSGTYHHDMRQLVVF